MQPSWYPKIPNYRYFSITLLVLLIFTSDAFKSTIQEAIAEYENKTCLTFKPRTGEDLFVKFVHEKG